MSAFHLPQLGQNPVGRSVIEDGLSSLKDLKYYVAGLIAPSQGLETRS